MRLYQAPASDFLDAVDAGEIVVEMEHAFEVSIGRSVADSERRSWQNSLPRLAGAFRIASLERQEVILEYQLPRNSGRLDAFVVGSNGPGGGRAYIVELKQWERCSPSEGDEVVTWLGGGERSHPHPSVQVSNYRRYLEDCVESFHDGGVALQSCAFLHNYVLTPGDALLDVKFEAVLANSPIYDSSATRELAGALARWVPSPPTSDTLQAVLHPRLRPSKKLMEAVVASVKGQDAYILLDSQITAMNEIVIAAKRARRLNRDCAVLVYGGPGTGKSAVAIQALGKLASLGFRVNLSFGNASMHRAITLALGPTARNAVTKFWDYRGAMDRSLDVLLCDEAHRMRASSNLQFTPSAQRTELRQIDEVFNVAHVPVFFIDDLQSVRSSDVGASSFILEEARSRDLAVVEVELASQFRCAGSDAFVAWVDDLLGIRATAHPRWVADQAFDFQLVDSPHRLRQLILDKHGGGASSRIMAGYCWPWSKQLTPAGALVEDVRIGDFSMPWNARPGLRGLPRGIPKDTDWAHQPGGIHQVGCIYTVQGFEFDYAGVIWGPDLVFDPATGTLRGNRAASCDATLKRSGPDFDRFVKQIYRVLLTRGMKGCYLHIVDDVTRNFVASRMESRGR